MTTDQAPIPEDAMQWSDQYLLGYTPIDEVHEEFVDLVGRMQSAEAAELPGLLDRFAEHLQHHFEMENRWMVETEFPPRDCHIDEHAAVMASVTEVRALPLEEKIAVTRDLVEALADWFPKHADQLDSALAHWMSKKRLGGKPVVLRRDLKLR